MTREYFQIFPENVSSSKCSHKMSKFYCSFPRNCKAEDKRLTVLVSEDRGADTAGPHPQGGGQLAGHLRVTSQVLPQAALVNVELAAHRTRVVSTASLGWQNINISNGGVRRGS